MFAALADHAATDPAALLYRRNRAALPILVRLVGDETATRSVISSPAHFRGPQIFMVGDLALGMLEGISGCGFRGRNGLAVLMLQAGSQAPLDYVRQRLVSQEKFTPSMARLLAEAGGLEDYKQLENLTRSWGERGRKDRQTIMRLLALATALAQHERRMNVPVMVAIIEGYMDTIELEAVALNG